MGFVNSGMERRRLGNEEEREKVREGEKNEGRHDIKRNGKGKANPAR